MVSEGYTSIIVVFDSAAFGCHMDDLSKTIDLAVLLNSDIQVAEEPSSTITQSGALTCILLYNGFT